MLPFAHPCAVLKGFNEALEMNSQNLYLHLSEIISAHVPVYNRRPGYIYVFQGECHHNVVDWRSPYTRHH